MPLTKASDIRELSTEELAERLKKLRQENFALLQKKEVGQLDRPSRFSHIRREIAQIMTVLSVKRDIEKKES